MNVRPLDDRIVVIPVHSERTFSGRFVPDSANRAGLRFGMGAFSRPWPACLTGQLLLACAATNKRLRIGNGQKTEPTRNVRCFSLKTSQSSGREAGTSSFNRS